MGRGRLRASRSSIAREVRGYSDPWQLPTPSNGQARAPGPAEDSRPCPAACARLWNGYRPPGSLGPGATRLRQGGGALSHLDPVPAGGLIEYLLHSEFEGFAGAAG